MFNDKNKTNSNDHKKGVVSTDPKKDTSKVTEPHKDGTKIDPKKDETIRS